MTLTAPPKLCDKCGFGSKTDRHLAECRHRYIVEIGGDPMPGASTIAGYNDDGGGLKFGAASLTAEIACNESWQRELHGDGYQAWLAREFDVRWSEKADLGTRVHDHALSWAQGLPVDSFPDEKPYLDALERFWIECVEEVTHAERIVGCPEYGYGARGDAWGVLRQHGVTCWDYKTGRREYAVLKDALQLTGLTTANDFLVYDDEGMLTAYEPAPTVESLVNVYLLPDGSYELYRSPIDARLVAAFRANCAAYHAAKAARTCLKEAGFKLK